MSYEKMLEKYRPKDKAHFYNGWSMWPNWWENSTEDWQKGYKARKEFEGKKNERQHK